VADSDQIAQLTAELAWLRRLTRALLDDTRGPDLAHDTWLVASTHVPSDGRPLRPWLARVALDRGHHHAPPSNDRLGANESRRRGFWQGTALTGRAHRRV